MNRYWYLFIFFFLISKFQHAAVCTANSSGAWSNAAIWSCAGGPGCGDVVIIPAGITVTITNQQDYSGCGSLFPLQIYISGCLKFTNGNKLKLPCNSNVFISSTGSMVPGTGSGNSNYLEICTNIQWNAGDGTATGPVTYCALPPCLLLPVELIAFTGVEEQKVVYLEWKTATETNNAHYDVERSIDGLNFDRITSVATKAPEGTSKTALDYNITDKDLKDPLYYYRLKQVDKDGKFMYSGMISVKIYAADFNIYPNPNTGVFSIQVPSLKINEPLSVTVFNSVGQKVYEADQSVVNDQITGAKVDIVPSEALPMGVYLTVITFQGEKHLLKFIVR